jgi:hypothetical protein
MNKYCLFSNYHDFVLSSGSKTIAPKLNLYFTHHFRLYIKERAVSAKQ